MLCHGNDRRNGGKNLGAFWEIKENADKGILGNKGKIQSRALWINEGKLQGTTCWEIVENTRKGILGNKWRIQARAFWINEGKRQAKGILGNKWKIQAKGILDR